MQETSGNQFAYLKATGHNSDCETASRKQDNKPLDTEEGRASGHKHSAKSDK